MVQLINKAFNQMMHDKHFQSYNLSSKKTGYWIEKDKLSKDKYEKTLLVGIIKGNSWHFGISAIVKIIPSPLLVISSHIFFTENGKKLIASKQRQIALRRKQGRNWWNDTWRNKLLAFVKYMSDDDNSFSLSVGKNEKIEISNTPIKFIGHRSYKIPERNTLQEEMNILSISDIEDDEVEL
jgi:hypothetical protein